MHTSLTTRSLAACAAVALAATLSGCAPQRPAPGALAPVAAHASNQSRDADLAVLDAWEAHRRSLLRNDGADLPTRNVALARAGAWLAFAREAYVERPAARDAADALAEARALMAPFDIELGANAHRGTLTTPAPHGTLAASADRTSPDNWAEVGRLAMAPATVADAPALAEAEIELVRAAPRPVQLLSPSVMLAGEPVGSAVQLPAAGSAVQLPSTVSESPMPALSCVGVQHVARAVALLAQADVVQQGEARQLSEIARLQQDGRVRARRVHFAVRSDSLGMPSAALLSGVAGALRAHPELSLAIQGYADPRGGDNENRELSGRRATTVRDILADSGVADDRMLVRQFGASRRASTGTTALDYARDRRVQLVFVLPDGEELPISESTALDLQIERVVKRSAAVRRRPGVRRVVKAPR
jgi:outer membrane protein OmpA-like peptidoglycan-associated protein